MNIEEILGNAKPITKRKYRDPIWLKEGKHTLVLTQYKTVNSKDSAPKILAKFVVRESTTHEVGENVTVLWKPYETPSWKGEKEASRAASFVSNLFNYGTDNVKAGRAALKLQNEENPGRGMQIRVTGTRKEGKTYVDLEWEHCAGQTAETLKVNRAFADEHELPDEISPDENKTLDDVFPVDYV